MMTVEVKTFSEIPNVPAVYALCGGATLHRGTYIAYVGNAAKLRSRIRQHLIARETSVITGLSAVSLNPDHVVEVRWWEHPGFSGQRFRQAAELVAFEVLRPALRSLAPELKRARRAYDDRSFPADEIRSLLSGEETGRFVVPSLRGALERIEELERRLSALEEQPRE